MNMEVSEKSKKTKKTTKASTKNVKNKVVKKVSKTENKSDEIRDTKKKKIIKIAKILFRLFLSLIILLFALYSYYSVKCDPCKYHPSKGFSVIETTTTSTASCFIFYSFFEKPKCYIDDVFKPLIYLYPEEEGDVRVKLGYPEKLSHSYPKYENEWVVNAKPNGDLTYNNRTYYGLYWEGKNAPTFDTTKGFVVKGSDTITFLEEKLAILGLTEREANEFIIYWLPKLENNPYNFIKFASMEVQNEYMPLDISPKPDTLIRVMMAFKKLDNPIEVREQVLAPTPVRNGFTVVEWGGTEINGDEVY